MNDIDIGKYFKPNLSEARKRKGEIEHLSFKLPKDLVNLGIEKKYIIQTYGCQANEADSEIIAGILEKMGHEKAETVEDSDLIILNTCAIREKAENRIWGELGRLSKYKKTNPNLLLIVAGCMPQQPIVVEKLLKTYPYVDIVMGTHNLYKLPDYLRQAYYNKERVIEVYSKEGEIIEHLPQVRNHQFKAWVNIMYGCDEFCTYCIVPYTRGKERSRLPEDIIQEVKELVSKGYQEVTLLGQNVNAYGKDLKIDYGLGELLYDLDKTGIPRIRYTTSHPKDLDLTTIKAMGTLKSVMSHLHLPVQSGSNKVLKKMNRHYTKEVYLEKIKLLKEHVPGISITTDIIVGFPFEDESDFDMTLDLVEKVGFEGGFTFIFSPRTGTPAFSFEDSTSQEEKKRRLLALNELINKGFKTGNLRFLNQEVEVLVDGPSKGNPDVLSGYSEHNKLVNFKGDQSLVGKIVKVKITEAKTWSLKGELV